MSAKEGISSGNVLVGEGKVATTNKLYHAVKVTGDAPTKLSFSHMVDLCVQGDRAEGWIVEDALINEGVHYITHHNSQVIVVAGAAVTRGDFITIDANGQHVPSTSGSTGDAIVGKALDSAAGQDSRFPMIPGNYGTV